ncbi:MAG: helix-turn-helix transcriptional regulator [Muribaculaceae bacterium]|nr:helix-turn-helix transcriptional regulator [Muribaculaceae bacterium]
MDFYNNSNNILSVLNNFTLDDPDDIMMQVAADFRKRRVEKNIPRKSIAEKAKVPLSSVARFEQKGMIAFESLIKLAMALGYTSEIKNIFSTPKFDTMAELDLIRQKSSDKRAYVKSKKK